MPTDSAPSSTDPKPPPKDDEVEIAATFLGSFVLGASFGKDFFLHGKFEARMFFLGISGFVLFVVIAILAQIRIRVVDVARPWLSIGFVLVFGLGNVAAFDLFSHQFVRGNSAGDIRLETTLFLVCYTAATNMVFVLNRALLFANLQRKTVYKYLLAPINGISAGTIVTALIVRLTE